MMKSLIAALGVAAFASLGFASAASATTSVNFGAVPFGATASFVGADLGSATSFNLGTTTLFVNNTFAGDVSGLSTFGQVTFNSAIFNVTTGSAVNIVETWNGANGLFTQTLTSVASVSGSANALNVTFLGTITGGGITESAQLSLSATTVAGGGINYSITNAAPAAVTGVPEASTWAMMLAGFGALGFAGYRRKSLTINA